MNGMRSLKKVALDSNIFIYYFNNDFKFGKRAKAIIDLLDNNKLEAITNVTTLIEVLSPKTLSVRTAREIENVFYSVPNLKIVDVDREIAVLAAQIRRQYGFRSPDCFQLASAVKYRSQAFVTNDKRLSGFKQIQVILLSSL